MNQTCNELFGYNLQELQLQICQNNMKDASVMAVLPTGFGKTVTFVLPQLFSQNQKITIVISPIKALVSEQVDALNAKNLNAMNLKNVRYNGANFINTMRNYRFIYCCPESFVSKIEYIRILVDSDLIGRFVVDEIHCLFDWVHFRPAYQSCLNFIVDEF